MVERWQLRSIWGPLFTSQRSLGIFLTESESETQASEPKVTEPVLEIQGRKNPGFLTPVLVLMPLGYSRQKFKLVMIYEACCTRLMGIIFCLPLWIRYSFPE